MLLSLDLATNLGWSLGDVASRDFAFGSHRLPSTADDIATFAWAFNDWLVPKLEGVTLCVFESPILPRQTSMTTVRKLSGLAWHVEFRCMERGIEVCECQIQSIKKYFAGSGRAKKPDMIRAAKALGYNVKNDDEADAIAVRLYTIEQRFPALQGKFSLDLGPLGAVAR